MLKYYVSSRLVFRESADPDLPLSIPPHWIRTNPRRIHSQQIKSNPSKKASFIDFYSTNFYSQITTKSNYLTAQNQTTNPQINQTKLNLTQKAVCIDSHSTTPIKLLYKYTKPNQTIENHPNLLSYILFTKMATEKIIQNLSKEDQETVESIKEVNRQILELKKEKKTIKKGNDNIIINRKTQISNLKVTLTKNKASKHRRKIPKRD